MVITFRSIAERWFARFPESDRINLRARFRSPIENAHQSAFFELYIHALFHAMNFKLKAHPSLPGKSTRPDFRAISPDGKEFLMEVTVAGLSASAEVGSAARKAAIYDALDRNLNSPNFFLRISIEASGAKTPATKKLVKQLECWLSTLDPDSVIRQHASGLTLPNYEWRQDDWHVEFSAIPKSVEGRGKPGVRPLGMFGIEGGWLQTDEDVRSSLLKKVRKYGTNLPVLIATNVISMHCDQTDMLNALFGNEQINVAFRQGRCNRLYSAIANPKWNLEWTTRLTKRAPLGCVMDQ
jgi:hypothetical protein